MKIGQREAIAQPQVQEHELTLRGGFVDRFGAGLRILTFLDRADIARRQLPIPPSTPAAPVARIAMSARANPEVRLAAPVRQIVARLMARRRVVRNFVHRVAAPRNFLAHRLIHRSLLVGRELLDSSALQVGEKSGAFLEGQVVGRDVIRFERRDRFDIEQNVRNSLTRNREDQIEIEPLEARAMRHPRRCAGLIGAVDAPEELQRRRVERLRAEADSIHARRAHPREFREVHGAGIRLERYFRVVFDSANAIGSVDNCADRFRIEQRRRSASKKDRLDALTRIRRSACPIFELGNQRARVLLFRP